MVQFSFILWAYCFSKTLKLLSWQNILRPFHVLAQSPFTMSETTSIMDIIFCNFKSGITTVKAMVDIYY